MIKEIKLKSDSISVLIPDVLRSACVFSLPHSGREYSSEFKLLF